MAPTALTMAMLMGLTGSLHCVGMCGPIMMVMPFHRFAGVRKAAALLLYHLARISVYALMGVALFSFREAFRPQVQQYVSVSVGGALLLAGIISFLPRGSRAVSGLPWSGFVRRSLGAFIGSPRLGHIAVAGALNGLLPCGLVYMALSATLSLGSPLQAAMFMYLFGLGTSPALVVVSVVGRRVPFLSAPAFRRLTPIFVFSFGCLFLLRGLNLGVPWLSPRVAIENGKVMHSCCGKK